MMASQTPRKTTCDGAHGALGRGWLIPAMVVAAGVVAYANSFSGVFLLDDYKNIVDSVRLHDFSQHWARLLATRRPVVNATLILNYAACGLDTWGYHLVNLIVHLAAGLTLFGVVRRTLALIEPAYAKVETAARLAGVIAILWVVHPVQTQSVTYIIQRGESLMGLFYLLTLYSVIRSTEDEHRRWWYIAAVASCAIGMGSKAVMITAPLIVLLYDRCFLCTAWREVFRRRWGLYAGFVGTFGVLVIFGVVRGIFASSTRSATVGFGYHGVTPQGYLATQPGVLLHYLWLCIWPDQLCLDYAWPWATSAGAIVLPGVIVCALLALTAWALIRRPRLGWVGACFFLILAPTSSFVPIRDAAFEHRLYLPLAAVITLVVLGAYALATRVGTASRGRPGTLSIAMILLAALVAMALTARTINRNRDYHDAMTMWQDVVDQRPNHVRALYNLGQIQQQRGMHEKAVASYGLSLDLNPAQPLVYYNLGHLLLSTGRHEQAATYLSESVRLDGRNADAHYALGIAHALSGRFEAAIEQYRQTLRLRPEYHNAREGLGLALSQLGRRDEAVREYQTLLRNQPDHQAAKEALASLLENGGSAPPSSP